ncbi:MAG: nucleotidyltransferase domain-containing protein [Actinobacteria bacterium]|nr:nucleotidyltransferase domain-containing protein [Actinomycetota bacterium]
MHLPPGLDDLPLHKAKLEAASEFTRTMPGVIGLVVSGSLATGTADAYSDLDLKIVTRDELHGEAAKHRDGLIDACGVPVARFTAEHVGHPGMLIVLYNDLVHIDFYLVRLGELSAKNGGLASWVTWSEEDDIPVALSGPADATSVDLTWIEARMWTWVWYTHSKILRGELYEALDALQYLRGNVLFALLAETSGVRPYGSRRAEQHVGELGPVFARTVPAFEHDRVMDALRATVELYLKLADPLLEQRGVEKDEDARAVVLAKLQE